MRTTILALACVGAACAGCRTTKPLPPADFSASGWRVQQGQAVWKPAQNKAALAGELLLATNANGNFFVQFSKTPFSLATAQVADGGWQIELGTGDYQRGGRGRPPRRFVWFQLPQALAGAGVMRGWRFERANTNVWRLENLHTSETLEGEFYP